MANSGISKLRLNPSISKQMSMDNAAANQMWNTLNIALQKVFSQKSKDLSFEELYGYGYKLVIHKHGELLYAGVTGTITSRLQETLVSVAAASNDQLLATLKIAWEEFKLTMSNIKDVLMYMDRTYVAQHKKIPVYTLSMKLFREVIITDEKIRPRLREILLGNIELERSGQIIDRHMMKSTLSMFVDLGIDGVDVYESDFESYFLEATRLFYRQESQEFLAQNTCADYMIKAEGRLSEEAARAANYLAPSTESKLKTIIESELILAHARTLVEMESSGCVYLMRENKFTDLQRMYNLFVRVPSTLDILRDCMAQYIKKLGCDIVADQETVKEPVVFVQQMLNLKLKFDTIIKDCFRGGKKCQKKLKDAFEEFMNRDTRCASQLAAYIDDLLKSGLRGITEEEADVILDRVIVIFRYLTDKDIFENFYKMHLSKRLLGGKSVSDEMEKSMIAKLKAECGYQFTSKLEGMFTDMQISRGSMEEFRRAPTFPLCPVEIDVQMLTAGYWPLQSPSTCRLPPQVAESCNIFRAFYLDKYEGRKLVWLTHLGTADMKANFPTGKRELCVSTYQMCILMQFNNDAELPLETLRAAVGVTDGAMDVDFRRHLLSLCTPKLKILKKASKIKGIADDDSFTLNEEFTSKFKRIKVPLISAKEVVVEDTPAVPAAVEEDRKHLVEAAIVRIMKARRILSHNELVGEISKQLSARFAPSPPFIKKRVESLIDREYLVRDKDDTRVYHYLA